MTIDELVEKQAVDTANHQAQWLSIVKKTLIESNGDRSKYDQLIKERADQFSKKLVRMSIGLGMDWLKSNDNASKERQQRSKNGGTKK